MPLDPDQVEQFRRLIMAMYRVDEFMQDMIADARADFDVPTTIPLANGHLMLIDPKIQRPFAVLVPWDDYSAHVAAVNPVAVWRRASRATGRVRVPADPATHRGRFGREPTAPETVARIEAIVAEQPGATTAWVQAQLAARHGLVVSRSTAHKYVTLWRARQASAPPSDPIPGGEQPRPPREEPPCPS